MKIDLGKTFQELGLPLSLVILFSAVLGLFGVSLDNVLVIVGGLVGTFVLIALLINILKWTGVITDGVSGIVSAIANLAVVVAVAVIYKLYPTFDFVGVDAAVGEFAKVLGLVFAYIVQITGSKSVHLALTRGLKIKPFSFAFRYSDEPF